MSGQQKDSRLFPKLFFRFTEAGNPPRPKNREKLQNYPPLFNPRKWGRGAIAPRKRAENYCENASFAIFTLGFFCPEPLNGPFLSEWAVLQGIFKRKNSPLRHSWKRPVRWAVLRHPCHGGKRPP